jgi:hypothetical protein
VDHRLTPKMRVAILAIVEDNKSLAEAAKVAGLMQDAIRKAMKSNTAAREFYASELKAPLYCAEGEGGARASGGKRADSGRQRRAAGFTILIVDARSFQQPIDVIPLNGVPRLSRRDRKQIEWLMIASGAYSRAGRQAQ